MEKLNNNYSFSKDERIRSKKTINEIYKSGKAINVFPLYSKYIVNNSQNVFSKVLISVSKKKFKKAVQRNKIKRYIREAYRLNKHILYNCFKKNNSKIAFVLNYSQNSMPSFQYINKSIKVLFYKICASFKENHFE